MTRKKVVRTALALEPNEATLDDPSSSIPGDDHEVLDVQAAAALLSVEYPLVDSTLIIALLSDYSPLLAAHLDEIRSQLGVIEATLVPDSEEVAAHPVDDIDSSSQDVESDNVDLAQDLDNRLTRLAMNDPAPFAATATELPREPATVTNRWSKLSQSDSVSRTSDTTSPTSIVDSEGGFEDDLSLLRSLFPSMSDKDLRDALVSESGVPAAIDNLLSLELIKGVERDGYWPGEAEQEVQLPPELPQLETKDAKPLPLRSRPVGSPALSSSSSRKKTTRTVPLVDTLQRRPTPSSSRPSSRGPSPPGSRSRSTSRESKIPKRSNNAWGTVSSLASYLSELLPNQPPTYFSVYLHSPDYHSAYTAVRASLRGLPTTEVASDAASRSILEDLYGITLGHGTRAIRDDLELCIKVAGDDVSVVMDLMDILGEVSEWPGDDDLHRYDLIDETGWSKKGLTVEVDGWEATRSGSDIRSSSDDEDSRRPVRDPRLRVSTSDGESETPPGSPGRSAKSANNTTRLTSKPPSKQLPAITKPKYVVGSRPPPSAWASPTAFDNFGSTPDYMPKSSRRSKSRDRQVHPQNWRAVDHARHRPAKVLHPLAASIPSYGLGQTPHNRMPGSLYENNPSKAQIEEYLANAFAERAKRESAIRAAGKSYRTNLSGNKAINGAVAGHYALQAREAAEKARGWELKAARAVVSDQLDRSGHTIDLHHMTIQEAVTVAQESAAKWYEREKARHHGGIASQSTSRSLAFVPTRGLTVVTGVGRHSAGQKGVLGPAVGNALEMNGWRVSRGDSGRGYLVVTGRK